MKHFPTHPNHRPRRGLSLAEVLIAGSIVAMLLIAVAASFDAMSQQVQVNTSFNQAAQTSRMGLRRIVQDVRTCTRCIVGLDASQAATVSADGPALTVIQNDGQVVRYVFYPDERTVRLEIDDPAVPLSVVVARDVSNAVFSSEVEPHPETGAYRTTRIVAQLWLEVGGQPLYLTGSAAPRREMVY